MGRILRPIFLRLAPSVILIGVFLLGFLGAPENSGWLNRSPLWGPGDPFFANTEYHFIASPLLVWRGRPDYEGDAGYPFAGVPNPFRHNGLGLRDDEIDPHKSPDTVRILNLGDSSTWGLNLVDRSETYSDQLERILNDSVEARGDGGGPARFDVINAGTTGYSSLQGARFLDWVIEDLKPDVVTVYLGNNDSAPARMKDSARVSGRLVAIEEVLSHNAFYLLLRKALLGLRASAIEEQWDRFNELVRKGRGSPAYETKDRFYRVLARVTPAEYEQNLRAMVLGAREGGARVTLLKVPLNLLWPQAIHPTIRVALRPRHYWNAVQIEPGYLARAWAGQHPGARPLAGHPYLSLITPEQLSDHISERGGADLPAALRATIEDAKAPEPERIRSLHNLGVWTLVQGDVDGAAELAADAAQRARRCMDCPQPPSVAQIRYTLGVSRLLQGRRDEALAHLVASREIWSMAMSVDYEKRFDRVVRELEVEWIDLPSRFAAADPAFWGSALIHDWVHPNARGHRVIAQAIAEKLLNEEPWRARDGASRSD